MTPALRNLITTSLLMLACGPEVQVDDAGAGASSNDGGGGQGVGGETPGGASPTVDLQAECSALCNQPCVGSPTLCTEYCIEAAWGGCGRESVELYACQMDYCVGEQDCTMKEEAVSVCLRRGGCQDPEEFNEQHYGPTCETAYVDDDEDACECTAPCLDGHTATVSCDVDWEDYDFEWNSPRHDCRCYFDGELVAECTEYYQGACLIESSCCRGWFAAD